MYIFFIAIGIGGIALAIYLQSLPDSTPEKIEAFNKLVAERQALRQPKTNSQGQIICAKCGSNQIHSEKRGWKLSTGLLGSSQIWITCLSCNHKWKSGKR